MLLLPAALKDAIWRAPLTVTQILSFNIRILHNMQLAFCTVKGRGPDQCLARWLVARAWTVRLSGWTLHLHGQGTADIHLFPRLHDPFSPVADLCLREAKPAHVFLCDIHSLFHFIHLHVIAHPQVNLTRRRASVGILTYHGILPEADMQCV